VVTSYDPKSCNALEKPFYKPIEAALRWCNLIAHEDMILQQVHDIVVPEPGMFPRWPCLRANTEKVFDALLNHELPHGRDGRTVQPDDHVAPHRLTVRHSDLKEWMQRRYPDQKPAFLFDEIERSTHAAINADTFRALQADRDALNVRLEKATDAYRTLTKERDAIEGERNSLRGIVDKMSTPGDRAETTYLNIIGGLLGLMLGKSPAGKAQSVFDSQASIISSLLAHHDGKPGLSARTLEDKFAEAKRALNGS
jgi:hypothetical protein